MVAKIPPFVMSDAVRARLQKGESRATTNAQLHINPLGLNTEAIPGGTPVYKRYIDEVRVDAPNSWFRFDLLQSNKFRDKMQNNSTEEVGDVDIVTALIASNGGEDAGHSAQINEPAAVVGHLDDPAWPGVHEFWFSTEDSGPAEFFKIGDSDNGYVAFTLNADGTITAETRNAANAELRSKDSDDALNDGQGYHIVYKDNGTTGTLYIDGVVQ